MKILYILLILFVCAETDGQSKYIDKHKIANNDDTIRANTYTIENKDIKVILARDKPVVHGFLLKSNQGELTGNPENSSPDIAFCEGAYNVNSDLSKVTYTSVGTGSTIIYHASVTIGAKPVIEFDLIYTLKGNRLEIEFGHVIEHENYYLLHVLLPGLIAVKADEIPAKLAISADAGRLIDVGKADLKDYEYEIDWLNPILAGFACNSKVIGILDTKSIENHTIVSVKEIRGNKFGSFSMKLIYRLNEYDLEEFGPKVPVTDPKNLLKVQDSCKVSVSIVGDYDQDGEISWVDGTKLLRDDVRAVPNPYYENKTFVRTFVDRPPTSRDPTGKTEELKFDDVLERIKEFAAQTDSAACVMYLLGWQYEGHDSGFPSVDTVNENLGGYEALVNLIETARRYNVNVTFHDNYDDSYPHHPGWDPDVICRDPQGELMKGGVWEGNQSFLISSYKYALKSGLDRVRFTLKKYPVREAYFIDVLSGGYNAGRKYDFNPESPAGAQKNFDGKLMIINEFNKNGLDVATEDFAGYFVGHVGSFGDIIAFDNIYFKNEEQIPLIPFIYHGKTSFGMKVSHESQYLKTFLYGQRAQKFTSSESIFTPADYILDALPKQKLYGKTMKSYHKKGLQEQVIYEDGSMVEVNLKEDQYSVSLSDHQIIAKDYTSFVPVDKNIFLACSKLGGLFSYPLPAGWADEKRVRVYKMGKEGVRTDLKFKLNRGNLEFYAEPNTPYKVIYQ